MNTIQLGSISTQIDISKYLNKAEIVDEQEQVASEIETELPSKGTKQYDELKSTLVKAKIPLTEDNIKTANLMIKNGIEVQKENIETVADIRKQVDYIINHINEDSVKCALNNQLSLDKITIDVLRNVIKETNKNSNSNKIIDKTEIKEATEKYKKENKSKDIKDEDISKYVEKLMQQGLPITDKNMQLLQNTVQKSTQIKTVDENKIINLLKKDNDITVESVYVANYSSNKYSNTKKIINNKDWENLLPQVQKIVQNENISNKDEAIKIAKTLLENEIPVTAENISEFINIKDLQDNGVDVDKLLDEAVNNIKQNKLVSDIDIDKILKSNKNKKSQQISKSDTPNQINSIDFDTKTNQYQKIIKDIPKFDDNVIKKALQNTNELTLKDLHLAFEQINSTEQQIKEPVKQEQITNSELSDEQKQKLKEDIEKELKTVTAKRQLAEIRLRLTSETSSILLKKGIEIDTLPLKDAIEQLKSVEEELYKSKLNIAGASASEENVQQMKDLYSKLSNINDLSSPTYKDIIFKQIPFTITGLSDAETINSNAEQIKMQQASQTYETLQTQPNPKFRESFNKIADQIEPLLQGLNIETTDENIRAAKILVKNRMEVNDENILDIKLVDNKVSEVTTQLHPIIAANMIRDGLKPAEMHVDEVLNYMNRFKELLGEDLTQKIASHIYEMDKSGEISEPERETMIGIYRMLYTIDKTQGRATGFVVKNNMDLTLNNLMEAANYYDRTSARYSDIDVKVNDDFGVLEKLVVDDKSIKSQLNKAYQIEQPTTNNTEQLSDSENIVNEFIQKITPQSLTKILKQNIDIENTPIKQIVKYIDNNVEDTQDTQTKPLSKMDIDKVLEYNNSTTSLTETDKQTILKLYNTFKAVQNIDDKAISDIKINDNLNLDDIKKSVDQFKDKIANSKNYTPVQKKNIINEFIQKLDVDTVKKIVKEYNISTPIEDIHIDKDSNISQLNIDEILNLKDLNSSQKQEALKLYNIVDTIKNTDYKAIQDCIKNDVELNLDNLQKAIDNFKTETEILSNTTDKSKLLNDLIQKLDTNNIQKIVKQYPNVDTVPVEEILKSVETELPNTKPIFKMNTDEILDYVNNSNLNQDQQQSILKIYNVFDSINNTNKDSIKHVLQNDVELNLNNLANSINEFKQTNSTKEQILNELVQKLDIDTLQNIVKQSNNIDFIPVERILNSIKTKLPKTDSKPVSKMSTDEILNYIEKPELSHTQKQNILKVYDIINTLNLTKDTVKPILQNDIDLNLNTLQNSIDEFKQNNETNIQKEQILNELVQKLDIDTLQSIVKQSNNIDFIPVERILNSIKTELPKTDSKSVAKMSTDEILNYINKSELNDVQKENVLKVYDIINTINHTKDTIKPVLQNTAELNLNNLQHSIDEFTQNTEINIQKEQILNELVQKLDIDTLQNIVKQSNNIDFIPVERILKSIETELPKTDSKPVSKMSTDEILNYIEKPELNHTQKQSILKVYDIINTISNIKEDIKPILQNDTELNLNNLQNSIKQFKTDIYKTQVVDEFIHSVDTDTVKKIINQYPDIDVVPINKIIDFIKANEKSKVNQNSKKLIEMDTDEIFNYINNSNGLSEKNKTDILKLYNIFNNIKDTDSKSIEVALKSDKDLNLNELKKSIDEFKIEKDIELEIDFAKVEKQNIVNEFIKTAKPETILKLIKRYPNIENTPIKELTNYIKGIEEDIKQPSITKLNTDELINYANKQSVSDAEKLIKIYNTLNSITETDSNSINKLLNSDDELTLNNLLKSIEEFKTTKEFEIQQNTQVKQLVNEFIQKADFSTISKIIKQNNNIEDIPIKDILNIINEVNKQNVKPIHRPTIRPNFNIKDQSESTKTPLVEMDIDKLYLNAPKDLSNKIIKIYDTLNTIQNTEGEAINSINTNIENITLNDLKRAVDKFENSAPETKTSKTELNNEQQIQQNEELYNTINEFTKEINYKTANKAIQQFKDIDKTPIKQILNFIKQTKLNTKNNLKVADTKNFADNQKVEQIINTIDTILKTDKNELLSLFSKDNTDITLEKLMYTVNKNENTNQQILEQSQKSELKETELNEQQSKAVEYERSLLNQFIQKAEPEVISKLIKQFPNIENIPVENILKSMEILQNIKADNNKQTNSNNETTQAKEFIKSLNKLSSVEPTTMLWMQKNNIPLTLENIDIMQNFIKNPFWFGQEINNLSQAFKQKFGEDKTLEKAVLKKGLSDLKKGKSVSNILDDLEEQIEQVKKEIIKLPQQERQNLWKQSTSLEKAIEVQKQVQKDEMFYQIPMQLHTGLTNLNLYVMNDKEGNGKLSDGNMKIFLAMETETLGTVQMYIKLSQKSVNFQINSDNPDATNFLKNQQLRLQSSIEDLGYIVNKIQYGQEQQKSPLQIQINSKSTGVNISDKGFEAII